MKSKKLTPSSTLEIAAWLKKRGYEFCPEALEEVIRQLSASYSKMTTEMPMSKYLDGIEYVTNMCNNGT